MILNKFLIEVGEAKEDLNIFIRLKFRLFFNSFNLYRVYYNTFKGNKIVKKLNKLSIKGVFKKFGI